jgi:hypothetical protein
MNTVSASGVERSIIGGGHIHIFVFTDLKNKTISKEINNAEHKYMNMGPPNYRSTPLVSAIGT